MVLEKRHEPGPLIFFVFDHENLFLVSHRHPSCQNDLVAAGRPTRGQPRQPRNNLDS
jgi:hypothetical protein